MQKVLIVMDTSAIAAQYRKANIVGFDTYLHDYPKRNEEKFQLINLCDTDKYLSKGYYCSLLAQSRSHTVFPSVRTINAMRDDGGIRRSQLSKKECQAFAPLIADSQQAFTFMVFMGVAEHSGFQKLAARLFLQYPVPMLAVSITLASAEANVKSVSFAALDCAQQQQLFSVLQQEARYAPRHQRNKGFRWDMAILVNPNEAVPPSSKRAIDRFVKAAAKLGIRGSVIQAEQLIDVSRFDALFIRETTAIDHYTYRIACEAEANGLVVIDDPNSILRCCNKVFLHDAFSYQNIPSPATVIVDNYSDERIQALEQRFSYPMVLKMPEGSFSKGVYKVADRGELQQRLQQLLQESALALVQEYLYTDYDWRIGVLNGRPLFACRYYMAPKHWQIYNHSGKRQVSGDFETMPTFEVPKPVLDAALRACKVVGTGLYGVDIKLKDDKAYVIEVNDNPSIDYKIEDAWLGEELYMQIMSEFHRRLELRGRE